MSYKEYLEDFSRHGEYQYVSIEQIINDYIANLDPDDHTAHVPRHRVLYQAMRGLRELYFDVLQEIKQVELDLSPHLNVILPPDFVNHVRISWVDESGKLHPMTTDRSSNIARSYLQDREYNILFDNQGHALTGSGTTGSKIPDDAKEYSMFPGYTPNINLSDYHKNGSFRIDKSNGIIQFDSNAKSKTIVIEYISDGLYTDNKGGSEADIRIHKFAEQALIDWIFWNLIKQRRNVPYNQKHEAKKQYFNSRRITRRRLNTLRKEELIQAMSGSTMNIEPSN